MEPHIYLTNLRFCRSCARDMVQHHKCVLCSARLILRRAHLGLHLRRCHGGMAVAEYKAANAEDLEPLFLRWNNGNPLRQ